MLIYPFQQDQPPIPPAKDTSAPSTPTKQDIPPEPPAAGDATKTDTAPLEQPVIPLQPPPGAKIALPPKPAAGNFEIGTILVPALWLIGILTFGALLIAWLKKNRDRTFSAVTLSPHEQLSSFREALEEGEMTEEEFKKVKAHLAKKIKPPATPAPSEPTPAPPPAEPAQE